MKQSAPWIDSSELELPVVRASKRLPILRFFLRYPIFLLAFGPPEFKRPIVGVDTSQAHYDIWNIIQVGWLSLIALRAILRLHAARSIRIPKQIRSILILPLLLGFLFALSVTYSPGRVISSEYCFLFFLNLICVVEFLVDVYRNPPNWMQCIFQLRLVALVLMALVLLTALIAPNLVMGIVEGVGIRLGGGNVASMGLYPEMIAIISAYTFLYSLESRARAAFLFLVGLAGTLITQTRGIEISLFIVLTVLAAGWAKTSRRSSNTLIAGLMAFVLFAGAVTVAVGPARIWYIFNRGQDIEGIETASGRTGVWKDQIAYCLAHPQGMGYIAGVRTFHRRDFSGNLHAALTNIGGTDNSFMEVLVDAGWLALALYLLMMVRTIALGWRIANRNSSVIVASDTVFRHPIRCATLLLFYCLAQGTENSSYAIPMFGAFYCQYIFIAIILGASATVLIASRPRHPSLAR